MTYSHLLILMFLWSCGPGGPGKETSVADSTPADSFDPDTDLPPMDTGPFDYDCQALPQPPFATRKVTATASEDLAFDREGNLVGSDQRHIFKSPYDGERTILVPNFPFRAGIRALPSGSFVVADNINGAIVRVEPNGTRYDVLTGLSYPNGIEVDPQGKVYFSEHDGRRVWRLDPYTSEAEVISDQAIINPNGLTFNEDFSALYIGGFSGAGVIYRLPIDAEGNRGNLQVWAKDIGSGWLDGMGVDACGNIYVVDYMATTVYRITPDGLGVEPILHGQEMGANYLPNMQWGSGVGGWDPMKLYMPEGWGGQIVYEIDLGVPSKPR